VFFREKWASLKFRRACRDFEYPKGPRSRFLSSRRRREEPWFRNHVCNGNELSRQFAEHVAISNTQRARDRGSFPPAAGGRNRGLETTSAMGTGFPSISPSMSRFLNRGSLPPAAGERNRGLETTSAMGTGFPGESPSMSRFLNRGSFPPAAGERNRGLETTSATGAGFSGNSPGLSRFLIPRGHAIAVPFLPPQARGTVV